MLENLQLLIAQNIQSMLNPPPPPIRLLIKMQPKQPCQNCLQLFPQSKIPSHFSYCRRNIKKCQICCQLLDINYKQQHEEDFHKRRECRDCGRNMLEREMEGHECEKKKVCGYCGRQGKEKEIVSHEDGCEGRWRECRGCGGRVDKREVERHREECRRRMEEKQAVLKVKQKNEESQNNLVESKSKQPETKPTPPNIKPQILMLKPQKQQIAGVTAKRSSAIVTNNIATPMKKTINIPKSMQTSQQTTQINSFNRKKQPIKTSNKQQYPQDLQDQELQRALYASMQQTNYDTEQMQLDYYRQLQIQQQLQRDLKRFK